MVERIFLGLGSNVGNRASYLRRAVRALKRLPGTRVVRTSRSYETSPVGPRQRDFLNAVVELRTELSPLALLAALKDLERRLGRRSRRRWGPREIDLDILFYGRRVLRSGRLQVPHPRWRERKFVLWPLAQIAPRWRWNQSSVAAWKRKLTDPDQCIRLFTPTSP